MRSLIGCLLLGLVLGNCFGKKEPPQSANETQKEPQGNVARGKPTPCTDINAPGQSGPATFSKSVCAPPGNCDPTNAGLRVSLGELVCKDIAGGACRPGDCPLPQDCLAEFASQSSRGVTLKNCRSAPDPACPAGQQRCTCDVDVAPRGFLSCLCECRST